MFDSQGNSSNVLEGTFLVTAVAPPPIVFPTVLAPGYSISLVASGLGNATGVAIGPSGDIFVTDYESSGGKIFKIDRTTSGVTEYASGFAYSAGIAFNSAGRLFVLSGGGASNSIYEVFANNSFGLFSSGPFSYAGSLAGVPGGGLYVTNGGNGTISKVSDTGVAQTYISGFASGNGPGGVSLDSTGNLYFAEHGTGRIYKCDTSKTVTLLATLSSLGPTFTAVDNTGTVFVADSLNATIYTIKSGVVGIFANGFKGKSTPPSIGPGGMAFDSAGKLYVADGDKLWKITPPATPPSTPFEVTYNLPSGYHIYGHLPVPQVNGFDYYFSPVILNSSLAGNQIRINSISVNIPGRSTGDVVNWDMEIYLGTSAFGLPDGQILSTIVDPVSGYARNAPVKIRLSEGEYFPANPTDYVFSASYDFTTSTLSGTPTPRGLNEAVRTELILSGGLYAQMFMWTADNRNCNISFGPGTLTVRGEIIQ